MFWLLFAPNVKWKWVDSNFQIIDLLVPPRAAGVAGMLIFVHIANFATLQPWLHVVATKTEKMHLLIEY